MWQSEVTEFFRNRKRNSNFQASKRQKVEVETGNSVPSNGTLRVSKSSSTKKTNASAVHTKSATKITDSKKQNTRSRKPKIQKESQNVRLDDIWKKPCDVTFSGDLNTTEELVFKKLSHKSNVCPSSPSRQHVKNCLSADCKDVSCSIVDSTKTDSGDRLHVSPSKRHLQENDTGTEKCETSAVADVATEAVDDHGNSHPCSPSKRHIVEHSSVKTATNKKRGRCVVPTNSSNYYKTPQKFDFSPYQSTVANQRSSSARKKLVLPNSNVTKSPPVFVFKCSTEKSPESSVAIEAKAASFTDVHKEAGDVIKSSDKTELADATSTANRDIREAETPYRSAASVVKIGTCRNLEQLKQKLRDMSPHKAKLSVTVGDTLSMCQRYR